MVQPGMIATMIQLEPGPGFLAGSPTLPPDHEVPLGDGSLTRGLTGRFRVGLALRPHALPDSAPIPLRIYLQYQACRDEGGCSLPVNHHIDILVRPA